MQTKPEVSELIADESQRDKGHQDRHKVLPEKDLPAQTPVENHIHHEATKDTKPS